MRISAAQFRHACALLNWSQLMLVWNARISHESARRILMGYETADLPEEHLQSVKQALEAAGIEFVPDDGKGPRVYLRKTT